MIAAFEGKNFHEMVAGGIAKMGSMGSGPAAAAPTAGKAAVVEEEKKEEVEEVDMGNLFGGDEEEDY